MVSVYHVKDVEEIIQYLIFFRTLVGNSCCFLQGGTSELLDFRSTEVPRGTRKHYEVCRSMNK